MNSRRWIPPIHVHPIVFFFLAVSILTGMLTELLIIFLIVLFHEMGHYLCARMFNWRIRRIYLWFFGGVMETEEYGTRPIWEEWLVTIAGPFQHLLIFLIIHFIHFLPLIPESTLTLAYQYNLFILLGNLLPILPLDGGRMVQLMGDHLLPYQASHMFSIVVSVVTIGLGLIITYSTGILSLSLLLLFIFLLLENRLEWKNRYYRWLRFLLYRHSSPISFTKNVYLAVDERKRLMDVFPHFYRNRYHFIGLKGHHERVFISESECLSLYFEQKAHQLTIGDIVR
ncbi:site-2 protease family protein [Gracilibacillus dipsosauri]|uniref:site-2 protease family protein n=1 Tax=Gracilibacillus dipsosauri TaxID=178340 RepID=UPI0024093E0F